jgi:FkbM family methyltransferase
MDKYKTQILKLFDQDTFPDDAFYAKTTFEGRQIVVYGAGECSHWFMEIVMKMYGYKPVAILDQRFTRGQTYEGIPAYSPMEYLPSDDVKQKAIAVICVAKRELHDEIIRRLNVLGFETIIFLMDIYEIHNPFSLPEELTSKGFDFYKEHKNRILAGLELFADDESREIYTRFLQTHMQRKPIPIPARPRQEQYFPKDIKLTQGYSRFINCGAYDGDTVRLLHKVNGKVDELICFEAENLLFKKLVDYLWTHQSDISSKIVAMPCAVYNKDVLMPFANCGGLGSRISENADGMVQCVTLDHVLPGYTPTFICMDVEGVEPEVLDGANKLIRESRPDLAICVYHVPNHLWDIPLYLDGLELNYSFYLRNYTTFTYETVCYATI